MPHKKKKQTFEESRQQVIELTQALQRERADSLNIRRRAEEQNASMGSLYKRMVIEQFLPAIDNLERSLLHTPKDLKDHPYVKGVKGVVKQFEQSLAQLGIEKIKTVGEPFDPRFHEAVHMEESSFAKASEDKGDYQEIITEEVQPGYNIDGEVLRPALVKVKKG